VQTVIETTFTDHLWHITVLMEKAAGFVDVSTKESGSQQGNTHNFGGRELDLGIIEVVHGLQEVVA
jgi:hypothetical protein